MDLHRRDRSRVLTRRVGPEKITVFLRNFQFLP